MNEFGPILEVVVAIAVTVFPIVVLVRLLAGPTDPGTVDSAGPIEAAWPLGVQEEEPRPWRFDPAT